MLIRSVGSQKSEQELPEESFEIITTDSSDPKGPALLRVAREKAN